MLTNPTLEKLQELRLTEMQSAYREQLEGGQYQDLTFDERLGFIVDREHTERHNRRLQTRLRKAKLRLSAAIEDIDYRAQRGVDKRVGNQAGSHRESMECRRIVVRRRRMAE